MGVTVGTGDEGRDKAGVADSSGKKEGSDGLSDARGVGDRR